MSAIPTIPFPVQSPANGTQRPRFSVITATFNSGPLFDRTAESLRAQHLTNFEWIVIDGESRDDTVMRIRAHADQVSHWISEPDRGISDAWNKGLALAQGDYILLLNAGDTYDADFLEQVDANARDSTRVICCHARLMTEQGEPVGTIRSEPRKLSRAMHLAHNWCAVPRKHYEQLGGYAEMRFAMDFEWFHRYYRRYGADGFTVIDAPLGVYHLGGTSDVNYAASFRTNADILIHHGTPSLVANFWRLAYTTKHAWRARRLQQPTLMRTVIVVPSLKISGGIREVLRLASELNCEGGGASVLSFWTSPHAMSSEAPVESLSAWVPRAARAPVELPLLAYRFAKWWRQKAHRASTVIFTHYATLPMALLIPRRQRFFFVQDLEWNFVRQGVMSRLLRQIVLGIYQSGRIISANAYLSEQLRAEGMEVALEAPIWADPSFIAPDAAVQDIDCAMVLRKGEHKRLDLYLRFIALARARGLRLAVITPEDDIVPQVRDLVDEVLLRPEHIRMRDLYARSACFIHLSEHEGFGLPPLEAMGAGCIPVCRDSGGVRAFMRDGPFEDLLLPLALSVEEILVHAEYVVRGSLRSHGRGAAREHFQRGLARCEQARRGLVAAMLKEAHQ